MDIMLSMLAAKQRTEMEWTGLGAALGPSASIL